jgi:beta-galactosidase GanA
MSDSKLFKSYVSTVCVLCVLLTVWTVPSEGAEIPHLRKQGSATQLIVDDKPFLIIGGELGNSSSSSMDYMKPIWPKLVQMNLNTILAPVYWDLIEPEEGRFDFSLVDGLIKDAREYDMRLVFLWFASWKNSMSCYAPIWVKENWKRFPRSQALNGKGMEILSPFSDENRDADARAFAALMRHIREVDGKKHTVIMVQVENEIGMIPEARDHSAAANELFNKPVPKELMDYLQEHKDTLIPEFRKVWEKTGFKTTGTWEEVFGRGPGTDEIFMAWYYARYVNYIVEAGKAEYPLPMFVNAALMRPNYPPGRYPSAGPLPHIMDIWRAGGPEIDFLAPDIYFPNFIEWCQKYNRSGNPLFIPEAAGGPLGAANVFYAVGGHDAIGFCPFSIESTQNPEEDPLAKSYDILSQLAPLILENQGKGTMVGVLPDVAFDGTTKEEQQHVRLGGYTLNVTFEKRNPWAPAERASRLPRPTGGIIISVGEGEYVIAGTGLVITFTSSSEEDPIAGIASIQEGEYINGDWVPGRWMNGDQSHQGRHLRIPAGSFGIQRIKLYSYR